MPNSGLGRREDRVISTFPSGHSFLIAVCSCFGSTKRSQGILWKTVSESYSGNTVSAEQGHGKDDLLETEGD